MRIFVVENHADTLKYLRIFLEALGHSVITARTMKEALELIPASDCEVFISDIGLPDGTGWELMAEARFSRPVYAVAISGYGAAGDVERSRVAGFRHHITKPFGPDDLVATIDEADRVLHTTS